MAVTQQLARLRPTCLQACRRSVDALSSLLRGDPDARTEELDLNWLPGPLEQALTEIGRIAAARTVSVATAGTAVLNEAYPSGPPDDPVWDGDVRFATPAEVAKIAAELCALGSIDFSRASATCSSLQADLVAGVQAAVYLARGMADLTEFYDRAAANGEAVAMWWD